jgi:chromosome partitioning protein
VRVRLTGAAIVEGSPARARGARVGRLQLGPVEPRQGGSQGRRVQADGSRLLETPERYRVHLCDAAGTRRSCTRLHYLPSFSLCGKEHEQRHCSVPHHSVITEEGYYMPKIVSFINLKGGVGKTTVAVNIASVLAKSHEKRVLVVDLDPQTNATVSLIDQLTWQSRHEAGQTLYQLFNDMLKGESTFDINQAILKDVGDVEGLDLLPSSLELVEIQDEIPDMDNKAYVSHVDVLGNVIAEVEDDYDFIIIDCPPNLGAITLNGINISDYYVVPTVPDILSKIGISLILNRIENFKRRKRTCKIELAGVVFTKVDYRTNLHQSTMRELRGRPDLSGHVFRKELPQRISIAEAPVDSKPFVTSPTAQNKADWADTLTLIEAVTAEFLNRVP